MGALLKGNEYQHLNIREIYKCHYLCNLRVTNDYIKQI